MSEHRGNRKEFDRPLKATLLHRPLRAMPLGDDRRDREPLAPWTGPAPLLPTCTSCPALVDPFDPAARWTDHGATCAACWAEIEPCRRGVGRWRKPVGSRAR